MSDPAQRAWRVVKLRPDGSVATAYPATGAPAPDGWVAVLARWTHRRVDIGHFAFEPGDALVEYFARDRGINAFATFRQSGEFVGWYCNVTYPTRVDDADIVWHDLYVDVVAVPDGAPHVLDEDELHESGLQGDDPSLYATILEERDEILRLMREGEYPFSDIEHGWASRRPWMEGWIERG